MELKQCRVPKTLHFSSDRSSARIWSTVAASCTLSVLYVMLPDQLVKGSFANSLRPRPTNGLASIEENSRRNVRVFTGFLQDRIKTALSALIVPQRHHRVHANRPAHRNVRGY